MLSTNGTRVGNLVTGPKTFLLGFLVAVLMACTLVLAIRPARADQSADLQSQAERLAQQIADGASRIHSLDAQYEQASSRASQLQSEVAALQAGIAAAENKVAARKATIRRAAVTAFMMNGSTSSTLSAVLGSDPEQLGIRRAYLDFTTGDLKSQIDGLHLDEQSLSAQRDRLHDEEVAAQAALDQVAGARRAATAQIGQEQAALAQVKGEEAQLVAQAEQAQLAAEANARRARAQAPPLAGRVTAPTQGQPTSVGLGSVAAGGGGPGGDAFAALRQCESGGNYAANTGNGFYGAYQFSASTWQGLGYSGLPSDAPPATQDAAARQLQASAGWGAWPTCSAILGL